MRISTLLMMLAGLTVMGQAQTWELLEPGMPVYGRPGEEVFVRVKGPPEKAAQLRLEGLNPLKEEAPGQYAGFIRIPLQGTATLHLHHEGQAQPLGRVGVMQGERFFSAAGETVTRQGPDPLYDRLTPLYTGAMVRLDGSRGEWYRAAESGTWIDGRGVEAREGVLSLNRLHRVVVEEAANGDALLRMECSRPPEVQVTESPATGTLTVRLEDTYSTTFDVKRPTGTAPFLGAVVLRPEASPRRVEFELSSAQLAGYQIENRGNTVVFRVRKPLSGDFSGLKVTVDAGHGGPEDSGTVGHGGLAEKTLNLRVAKVLAEKLEQLGAEVTMTRVDDEDVAEKPDSAAEELQARIDHSIEKGSQLFLSVHHNARPSVEEGKTYHGTDIYWYQPHSQALAKSLADPIADAIGEEKRSYRWRSFYVIRQTHAPAVLLEFQYLSNPELERELLSKESYPARAAEAVVEGLRAYLRQEGR